MKRVIKPLLFFISMLVILLSILPVEIKSAEGFLSDEINTSEIIDNSVKTNESVQVVHTFSMEEQKYVNEILDEEQKPEIDKTKIEEVKTEEIKTESIIKDNIIPSKEETKKKEEQTTNANSDKEKENYVGRFKISSVGIDVACYESWQQSVVDAEDSAAYFYGYGNVVIADHKTQGFSAIKECQEGTRASLISPSGTREYVFVDKILGHNTGEILTDSNGTPIEELYRDMLICYTCNENWKNITIVIFKINNPSVSNAQTDVKEENNQTETGIIVGEHSWTQWSFEWKGSLTNGRKFHWESRECTTCLEEEWRLVYDETEDALPEIGIESQ